ncbi:MAG: DUF2752 domain-containing protein [Lysobacteraceae bacterium]|nr:MAG: DUF2752 domain-containing protein [Xanthomonadaceae bacterium]
MALRPLHLALVAAAMLAAATGAWLLWNFDPNAPDNPFPRCSFRALTGYYCIGCGMTRAMHALIHGDLATAIAMNPLVVLSMPLIPMVVAHSYGWKPRALLPMLRLTSRPAFWLILLPAYWVARNLPWWPFTWLAPG